MENERRNFDTCWGESEALFEGQLGAELIRNLGMPQFRGSGRTPGVWILRRGRIRSFFERRTEASGVDEVVNRRVNIVEPVI